MMNLFSYALAKRGAEPAAASEVDLSDYTTKEEVEEMLTDYAKKTDIRAYNPFPEAWNSVADDSSKTIDDLCNVINNDDSAIGGMVFLGGIRCGLSEINGLNNADAVVEIISGTTKYTKVIHIIMTSGSIAPYRWEYTYWSNGNLTSGDWISWQLA